MSMQNDFSLKGSVAIVTGGAGNLGPHFTQALAEAGATVVLADLPSQKSRGEKAAREISLRTGGEVLFCPLNVVNEKSVKALMRGVVQRFKKIDVLVNAAMGTGKNFYASIEKYTQKDFEEVLNVNVTGTFLCSRAVAGVMKRNKSGSIINIASIYGVVAADPGIYGKSGIHSPASYAASKGAIVNLTRYMAVHWAKDKIRVNAISPGGVFNDQPQEFVRNYSKRTPLGRMAQKADLKGAVVFLASPASGYVTGHNLLVDGGWTAW